ncbi:MAG: oligosaccharide flippase family protein [Bacilli bacterium]|nr:oligosaccharide flippase family protein [Bacilli bacterium]
MENEESIQRKSGAILSYVAIIVNTLIQILYTPFLLRMLGQNEYGLYSLVSSIIGYLTVLDLGFGNAIIVYTSKFRSQKKYDEEKKLHGMFYVIFFLIGVIAGILGLILYFNVENIFGATLTSNELSKAKMMMLILSFNLFVTFAFSIYSSILSAYERFTFKKLISILSSLLKPLIMIPFLFLGFKSITLIIVITIVNILVCLSNYVYCRKKLKIKIKFCGFDNKIFKVIFGYSIFIFLGEIVDKINWSADQFILGAVSGTAAVSIYSIASQLNNMFISFSSIMSGIFLPKISKMVAKNVSDKKLSDEFIKIGRIQFYIIFLMCSGLVLFGKKFISLWAGPQYDTSYYVSLILIIPVCVPLIQTLGLSIMQAKNKYSFRAVVTFIMAFVNIGISIILAKHFGPVGAAVGTAFSLIVCNIIVLNIYYSRILKLNVMGFWKEIFKEIIFFVIPIVIILAIMNLISIDGWFGLIIFCGVYVILYCLTAYFLVMNKYERGLVVQIIKKFI